MFNINPYRQTKMSLLKFRKQTQEKWHELIHDGPRMDTSPVGMIMYYQRKQYALPDDIAILARDYLRLKPDQQMIFKERFEGYLCDLLNKNHITTPLANPKIDECKFVERSPTTEHNCIAQEPYDPSIILDGRNYQYTSGVDPSGFFIGRGDSHPYHGCHRRRILPQDVTINCSGWLHPEKKIHDQWGGVVCEPYASWLASWKDPVTHKMKYIFIPKNSEYNQRSDRLKYDAAYELSKKIEEIRCDYWSIIENHRGGNTELLQIALVLYLVDHFSIRIGNPTESRTFGACTLRKEHVMLLKNNYIQLDFPGKDSVRYSRRHDVDPSVYAGLKKCLSGGESERIFPSCSPGDINKYLHGFGEFSIKSFRTMNACLLCNSILQRNLEGTPVKDKLSLYNKACSHVAEACNHQRKTPYGSITYSVTTGKGNYIDPRIVVSFCRRNTLPIGQCYSKVLLEKNSWAVGEMSPWDRYY
jgi:DNA topoisomerase-1